jgi:hypothetical protein
VLTVAKPATVRQLSGGSPTEPRSNPPLSTKGIRASNSDVDVDVDDVEEVVVELEVLVDVVEELELEVLVDVVEDEEEELLVLVELDDDELVVDDVLLDVVGLVLEEELVELEVDEDVELEMDVLLLLLLDVDVVLLDDVLVLLLVLLLLEVEVDVLVLVDVELVNSNARSHAYTRLRWQSSCLKPNQASEASAMLSTATKQLRELPPAVTLSSIRASGVLLSLKLSWADPRAYSPLTQTATALVTSGAKHVRMLTSSSVFRVRREPRRPMHSSMAAS